MGSRTNWEIRTYEGSPSIYLYSHWGGDSKWSDTVAALSAAEPRWSDPAYGARIFISQIVGKNWDLETGFGILAGESGESPFEESYFSMVIDFTRGVVETGLHLFTFREFLDAVDSSEEEISNLWGEMV